LPVYPIQEYLTLALGAFDRECEYTYSAAHATYDAQMALMLEHTSKPIVFVTNDKASCQRAIDMAAAVQVPVFMSSLLQVPFAQQLIGPDRVVGILMAHAKYLTVHHLASVGVQPDSNYVFGGAMDDDRCT